MYSLDLYYSLAVSGVVTQICDCDQEITVHGDNLLWTIAKNVLVSFGIRLSFQIDIY